MAAVTVPPATGINVLVLPNVNCREAWLEGHGIEIPAELWKVAKLYEVVAEPSTMLTVSLPKDKTAGKVVVVVVEVVVAAVVDVVAAVVVVVTGVVLVTVM
jgi:hypothetical protein